MEIMRGKKYDEDSRMFQMYANYKKKCSCGHVVVMRPDIEKVICTFCGKYVFNKKEDEFKYRIKEKMMRS